MNEEPSIFLEKEEVVSVISRHYRSTLLRDILEDTENKSKLIQIVSRYIYYSSAFSGSQASLAGAIAVRQDMFRDISEPEITSDNCVEIASGFFYAAIDEFGDREHETHATHRSLAQATLKGLARYYQCSDNDLNTMLIKHEPTQDARVRARNGYGINMAMDEEKIFQAMGFHLAAEILGDEEFCILYKFLCDHQPELVDYLKQVQVSVRGTTLSAYFWIQRHTTAEADHFVAALDSANLALKYYFSTHPDARAKAKQAILDGFSEYAKLENDFISHIAHD